MDVQTIVIIFVALIALAAGASFFPNPKVQMYGKIALISLAAIFLLVLIFFKKKPNGIDTKSQQFTDQINEVKNNIKEITVVTKLKTEFIKKEETEKLNELKEVTNITDKDIRRKKLADMLG